MKKRQIKILSCLLALTLIVLASYFIKNNENKTDGNVTAEVTNLDEYPKDTRERFIAGQAIKKDIPYELAEDLEEQELNDIQLSDNNIVKYKTFDKIAGKINGKNGYAQPIKISTDVRYIWDSAEGKLVKIDTVGKVSLYLPDIPATSLHIQGGEVNQDLHSKEARISQTVILNYEIQNRKITDGEGIEHVEKHFNKSAILTKPQTPSITITESDF